LRLLYFPVFLLTGPALISVLWKLQEKYPVPGKPDQVQKQRIEAETNYTIKKTGGVLNAALYRNAPATITFLN
jgi:hypothetical protein